MHDPPPAYRSFVQRVGRQVERNVSFELLACRLISKCLNVVMLACCDVMESNSLNHVCNRKKDKVCFCDVVVPLVGSVCAAKLSHLYQSSSINSLKGEMRQTLKKANLQNLCS